MVSQFLFTEQESDGVWFCCSEDSNYVKAKPVLEDIELFDRFISSALIPERLKLQIQ